MIKMYVHPNSGLCNRMRVIASAYEISKASGKQMVLIWQRNAELNCDYDKLFSLPNDIKCISYSNDNAIRKHLIHALQLMYKIKKKNYDKAQILSAVNDIDIFNSLYMSKFGFYIETCYGLRGSYEADTRKYDYSIFQIKPEIMKRIPDQINNFPCIGVHVRRTDHLTSIRESPLDVFYAQMDNAIIQNDEIRFFLATDSSEVITAMKQRYGSRIISMKSVLDRNSEQGITDAMVELVSLSKCAKILGSTWSSFSTCAAVLGNIPLTVCTRETNKSNTQ